MDFSDWTISSRNYPSKPMTFEHQVIRRRILTMRPISLFYDRKAHRQRDKPTEKMIDSR